MSIPKPTSDLKMKFESGSIKTPSSSVEAEVSALSSNEEYSNFKSRLRGYISNSGTPRPHRIESAVKQFLLYSEKAGITDYEVARRLLALVLREHRMGDSFTELAVEKLRAVFPVVETTNPSTENADLARAQPTGGLEPQITPPNPQSIIDPKPDQRPPSKDDKTLPALESHTDLPLVNSSDLPKPLAFATGTKELVSSASSMPSLYSADSIAQVRQFVTSREAYEPYFQMYHEVDYSTQPSQAHGLYHDHVLNFPTTLNTWDRLWAVFLSDQPELRLNQVPRTGSSWSAPDFRSKSQTQAYKELNFRYFLYPWLPTFPSLRPESHVLGYVDSLSVWVPDVPWYDALYDDVINNCSLSASAGNGKTRIWSPLESFETDLNLAGWSTDQKFHSPYFPENFYPQRYQIVARGNDISKLRTTKVNASSQISLLLFDKITALVVAYCQVVFKTNADRLPDVDHASEMCNLDRRLVRPNSFASYDFPHMPTPVLCDMPWYNLYIDFAISGYKDSSTNLLDQYQASTAQILARFATRSKGFVHTFESLREMHVQHNSVSISEGFFYAILNARLQQLSKVTYSNSLESLSPLLRLVEQTHPSRVLLGDIACLSPSVPISRAEGGQLSAELRLILVPERALPYVEPAQKLFYGQHIWRAPPTMPDARYQKQLISQVFNNFEADNISQYCAAVYYYVNHSHPPPKLSRTAIKAKEEEGKDPDQQSRTQQDLQDQSAKDKSKSQIVNLPQKAPGDANRSTNNKNKDRAFDSVSDLKKEDSTAKNLKLREEPESTESTKPIRTSNVLNTKPKQRSESVNEASIRDRARKVAPRSNVEKATVRSSSTMRTQLNGPAPSEIVSRLKALKEVSKKAESGEQSALQNDPAMITFFKKISPKLLQRVPEYMRPSRKLTEIESQPLASAHIVSSTEQVGQHSQQPSVLINQLAVHRISQELGIPESEAAILVVQDISRANGELPVALSDEEDDDEKTVIRRLTERVRGDVVREFAFDNGKILSTLLLQPMRSVLNLSMTPYFQPPAFESLVSTLQISKDQTRFDVRDLINLVLHMSSSDNAKPIRSILELPDRHHFTALTGVELGRLLTLVRCLFFKFPDFDDSFDFSNNLSIYGFDDESKKELKKIMDPYILPNKERYAQRDLTPLQPIATIFTRGAARFLVSKKSLLKLYPKIEEGVYSEAPSIPKEIVRNFHLLLLIPEDEYSASSTTVSIEAVTRNILANLPRELFIVVKMRDEVLEARGSWESIDLLSTCLEAFYITTEEVDSDFWVNDPTAWTPVLMLDPLESETTPAQLKGASDLQKDRYNVGGLLFAYSRAQLPKEIVLSSISNPDPESRMVLLTAQQVLKIKQEYKVGLAKPHDLRRIAPPVPRPGFTPSKGTHDFLVDLFACTRQEAYRILFNYEAVGVILTLDQHYADHPIAKLLEAEGVLRLSPPPTPRLELTASGFDTSEVLNTRTFTVNTIRHYVSSSLAWADYVSNDKNYLIQTCMGAASDNLSSSGLSYASMIGRLISQMKLVRSVLMKNYAKDFDYSPERGLVPKPSQKGYTELSHIPPNYMSYLYHPGKTKTKNLWAVVRNYKDISRGPLSAALGPVLKGTRADDMVGSESYLFDLVVGFYSNSRMIASMSMDAFDLPLVEGLNKHHHGAAASLLKSSAYRKESGRLVCKNLSVVGAVYPSNLPAHQGEVRLRAVIDLSGYRAHKAKSQGPEMGYDMKAACVSLSENGVVKVSRFDPLKELPAGSFLHINSETYSYLCEVALRTHLHFPDRTKLVFTPPPDWGVHSSLIDQLKIASQYTNGANKLEVYSLDKMKLKDTEVGRLEYIKLPAADDNKTQNIQDYRRNALHHLRQMSWRLGFDMIRKGETVESESGNLVKKVFDKKKQKARMTEFVPKKRGPDDDVENPAEDVYSPEADAGNVPINPMLPPRPIRPKTLNGGKQTAEFKHNPDNYELAVPDFSSLSCRIVQSASFAPLWPLAALNSYARSNKVATYEHFKLSTQTPQEVSSRINSDVEGAFDDDGYVIEKEKHIYPSYTEHYFPASNYSEFNMDLVDSGFTPRVNRKYTLFAYSDNIYAVFGNGVWLSMDVSKSESGSRRRDVVTALDFVLSMAGARTELTAGLETFVRYLTDMCLDVVSYPKMLLAGSVIQYPGLASGVPITFEVNHVRSSAIVWWDRFVAPLFTEEFIDYIYDEVFTSLSLKPLSNQILEVDDITVPISRAEGNGSSKKGALHIATTRASSLLVEQLMVLKIEKAALVPNKKNVDDIFRINGKDRVANHVVPVDADLLGFSLDVDIRDFTSAPYLDEARLSKSIVFPKDSTVANKIQLFGRGLSSVSRSLPGADLRVKNLGADALVLANSALLWVPSGLRTKLARLKSNSRTFYLKETKKDDTRTKSNGRDTTDNIIAIAVNGVLIDVDFVPTADKITAYRAMVYESPGENGEPLPWSKFGPLTPDRVVEMIKVIQTTIDISKYVSLSYATPTKDYAQQLTLILAERALSSIANSDPYVLRALSLGVYKSDSTGFLVRDNQGVEEEKKNGYSVLALVIEDVEAHDLGFNDPTNALSILSTINNALVTTGRITPRYDSMVEWTKNTNESAIAQVMLKNEMEARIPLSKFNPALVPVMETEGQEVIGKSFADHIKNQLMDLKYPAQHKFDLKKSLPKWLEPGLKRVAARAMQNDGDPFPLHMSFISNLGTSLYKSGRLLARYILRMSLVHCRSMTSEDLRNVRIKSSLYSSQTDREGSLPVYLPKISVLDSYNAMIRERTIARDSGLDQSKIKQTAEFLSELEDKVCFEPFHRTGAGSKNELIPSKVHKPLTPMQLAREIKDATANFVRAMPVINDRSLDLGMMTLHLIATHLPNLPNIRLSVVDDDSIYAFMALSPVLSRAALTAQAAYDVPGLADRQLALHWVSSNIPKICDSDLIPLELARTTQFFRTDYQVDIEQINSTAKPTPKQKIQEGRSGFAGPGVFRDSEAEDEEERDGSQAPHRGARVRAASTEAFEPRGLDSRAVGKPKPYRRKDKARVSAARVRENSED